MRNRAKCKACGDVVEAANREGYVSCKCGDISVCEDAGQFRAHLKNRESLLLVDDEGNEIVPKVPQVSVPESTPSLTPTKKELIDMLDEMRTRIEELPKEAMLAPVTHSDFCSLLMLLSSILRAD